MVKVAIVDDHQLMIEGLKLILSEASERIKVTKTFNKAETLLAANLNNVDILLLDIKMPEINGIEAAEKLKVLYPKLKIIALSMFDDNRYIYNMMKIGIEGYMLKNSPKSLLIKGVLEVAAGNKYFDSTITNKVFDITQELASKSKTADYLIVDKITNREMQIIKLIAEKNLSSEEIGLKLELSKRTIEAHRRNIMRKINVNNSAGIVKFAVDNDL